MELPEHLANHDGTCLTNRNIRAICWLSYGRFSCQGFHLISQRVPVTASLIPRCVVIQEFQRKGWEVLMQVTGSTVPKNWRPFHGAAAHEFQGWAWISVYDALDCKFLPPLTVFQLFVTGPSSLTLSGCSAACSVQTPNHTSFNFHSFPFFLPYFAFLSHMHH